MATRLNIRGPEVAKSIVLAVFFFVVFGTVAAVWRNPFFTRMTPTSGYEITLLALESLLLGLYLSIKVSKVCPNKKTMLGGVLGFLGIACPVCNQILLALFGATVLLTYFEPVRLYVGIVGVIILFVAVKQKLSLRSKE